MVSLFHILFTNSRLDTANDFLKNYLDTASKAYQPPSYTYFLSHTTKMLALSHKKKMLVQKCIFILSNEKNVYKIDKMLSAYRAEPKHTLSAGARSGRHPLDLPVPHAVKTITCTPICHPPQKTLSTRVVLQETCTNNIQHFSSRTFVGHL